MSRPSTACSTVSKKGGDVSRTLTALLALAALMTVACESYCSWQVEPNRTYEVRYNNAYQGTVTTDDRGEVVLTTVPDDVQCSQVVLIKKDTDMMQDGPQV